MMNLPLYTTPKKEKKGFETSIAQEKNVGLAVLFISKVRINSK
jgi:hypothetical protein